MFCSNNFGVSQASSIPHRHCHFQMSELASCQSTCFLNSMMFWLCWLNGHIHLKFLQLKDRIKLLENSLVLLSELCCYVLDDYILSYLHLFCWSIVYYVSEGGGGFSLKYINKICPPYNCYKWKNDPLVYNSRLKIYPPLSKKKWNGNFYVWSGYEEVPHCKFWRVKSTQKWSEFYTLLSSKWVRSNFYPKL